MNQFPPEILVMLTSITPFIEYNGSIPLGIMLGMSTIAAGFWSFLANNTLGIFLKKYLAQIINQIIKRIGFIEKHFQKTIDKLQKKHSEQYNKLGTIFLLIFVFLPIPGSGTYGGVLVSYIFNIPFKNTVLALTIGNIAKVFLLIGGIETFLYFF